MVKLIVPVLFYKRGDSIVKNTRTIRQNTTPESRLLGNEVLDLKEQLTRSDALRFCKVHKPCWHVYSVYERSSGGDWALVDFYKKATRHGPGGDIVNEQFRHKKGYIHGCSKTNLAF